MTLTSLADFSRSAAREYLQSAVFIDDNIYTSDTGTPKSPQDIAVRELKPAFVETPDTGPSPNPEAEAAVVAELPPFRTQDLVSSFAEHGIVCALYEPEPDFPTHENSVVFKLCETADLVILDWDFHEVGVKGTKPKSLIENLIKSGNRVAPHHIRLIAIYTNSIDLPFISNSIYEHLKGRGCNPEPIGDSGLRLQSGSSRIVVLGKDGMRRAADQEDFVVKESALADRLLQEFAEMNAGILPSYALHGMAAIRRNSKRVLDRFHGNMSGAFLLHRAFSEESEEAFEQLHALLAEELQAILEDNHLDPATISRITEDATSNIRLNSPQKDWFRVDNSRFSSTHYLATEVLKELLMTGHVTRTNYPEVQQVVQLSSPGFSGIGSDLMRDLMAMVDVEKSNANQRLASLFASRTQYDESTRRLSYGTIVRRQQPEGERPRWIYSFCLMPVCDSIRLQQSKQHRAEMLVKFPFWRLRDDVFSDSNAPRRGVALQLSDDSYVLLSAGGKSRDMLWVGGFNVNVVTGTVTATRNPDGRFLFVADENTELEWVAELKPLHAQRIAYDVGQSLSRVGLVEAEWLRLLCDS